MIKFGTNESWMWHVPTGELRFQVSQDDKQILCRVTRECITDHCGNPIGEDACFTAAKEHFEVITDQTARCIAVGHVEPDGSILLRSADWR